MWRAGLQQPDLQSRLEGTLNRPCPAGCATPPLPLSSAPWRLFAAAPSLLWFHSSLGLSVDAAQLALAAAGLALALTVLWALSSVGSGGSSSSGSSGALRPGAPGLAAAMGGLWLLLLSARSVGQGFLSGAW
jgi:hypothetical protein